MGRRKDYPLPSSVGDEEKWAKGEWWEWLAIFFSIAALWPVILRWDGIIWDLALFGALVLMIMVFLRRARRMKRSWKQ